MLTYHPPPTDAEWAQSLAGARMHRIAIDHLLRLIEQFPQSSGRSICKVVRNRPKDPLVMELLHLCVRAGYLAFTHSPQRGCKCYSLTAAGRDYLHK